MVELDEGEEADEIGEAGVERLFKRLPSALDVLEEELNRDGGGQVGEVVETTDDGGVETAPLGLVQVDLEKQWKDAVRRELLESHTQELAGHGPAD